MSAALLEIDALTLEFRTRAGTVKALERVSLSLAPGTMLGVVGESGSGKSVTAFAVMGLLDPAARVVAGRISYRGEDLLGRDEAALRRLRGVELSMIFQNPRTALNPIRSVGRQLVDVLRAHRALDRRAAVREAIVALAAVQIPDPERRARAYPFELSGGMCQRVMIALALACAPKLLIADEPTTGLDVTTQAVIMDLIKSLARERGMATIFITHDLALAAEHCDRIAVMHAGQVVETAPTATLFADARHPYTRRLIAATPRPTSRIDTIETVPGGLPDLVAPTLPTCRYSARCERYARLCDEAPLPTLAIAPGHDVACRRAT